MSTPGFDVATIVPTKWKPIVGLIGSLLTLGIPYLVSVEQYLPAPWPLVIGVVIALLTSLGIYHAPYKPPGTVLVPETVAPAPYVPAPPPPVYGDATPGRFNVAPGEYRNPWPQP